jgi:metal-responsive CopG/Arc/MetJ family transcriptional regulator
MKTAVSIPDDVFAAGERLARRSRKTRSEVYAAALREYAARHTPDEVTDAFDRVCRAVQQDADPGVTSVARDRLQRVEW